MKVDIVGNLILALIAANVVAYGVLIFRDIQEGKLTASGRCHTADRRLYFPPAMQAGRVSIPSAPYEKELWKCAGGKTFWRAIE